MYQFKICVLLLKKDVKTVPEISYSLLILVAKALQEFDLALRGKKKRKKFMKDAKKKGEMTVSGWVPAQWHGSAVLVCSVLTSSFLGRGKVPV